MVSLDKQGKYRRLIDHVIDKALQVQETLVRRLFASDEAVLMQIAGVINI